MDSVVSGPVKELTVGPSFTQFAPTATVQTVQTASPVRTERAETPAKKKAPHAKHQSEEVCAMCGGQLATWEIEGGEEVCVDCRILYVNTTVQALLDAPDLNMVSDDDALLYNEILDLLDRAEFPD